jgi:hypothetical protein
MTLSDRLDQTLERLTRAGGLEATMARMIKAAIMAHDEHLSAPPKAIPVDASPPEPARAEDGAENPGPLAPAAEG